MPFVLLYLAVEIVAVVALASWIGVGWTLLILFLGAVLGLWLARREGLRALRALAEAARDRRVAHVELTDGLLVAAGGRPTGPRPGGSRPAACCWWSRAWSRTSSRCSSCCRPPARSCGGGWC